MPTRRQPARRPRKVAARDPGLAGQLVESSLDGILAFNLDHRCTYWNPAMERATGYSREEVLGKSIFEVLPILADDVNREHIAAALAGRTGVIAGLPYRFPRMGRRGWVDAHYSPLLDAGRAVVGGQAIVRDVTAYRRAMDASRENQERFRALFEEAPVAYHEIDHEGIVRRVNRAECELMGFRPDEILDRHISVFVTAEERESSREAVRRKIAGEQPLAPFRRDFTRSDGVRLRLEIHENLIRNPDGQVTGIRSALLDVSERQRAQDELEARVRERTEALRQEVGERRRAEQQLALQYAAASILAEDRPLSEAMDRVLEAVCRCLEWNGGVFWTLDSRTGQPLSRTLFPPSEDPGPFDPEQAPGFVARVWRARRPLWIPEEEAPNEMRSGLAFPVLAGEEDPVGVVAFFCATSRAADVDLIETAAALGRQIGQFIIRRSAEDALQRGEARFAAFMDHLPGIAYIKDLEGRYVYFNARLGAPESEGAGRFLGNTDEQVWPPEVAALSRANDRAVLASSRALETVEQLPGERGGRLWLISRFPILSNEGTTVFLGAVGLDITDRRQLEDQLRHSQKMEAVGRLAGGVAHDFNNLLTIIGGYGRMVLDQLPSGDRSRSNLEMILNAADRAAVLTSQLLAFSRRQVAQPKILQLNHVVSNVEKMLRRVIGEHITLRTELDPDLTTVKVDPGQMEQILMNLAVNARDAMPEGGTLTIETTNQPSRMVRLSVFDTGAGMDAETRSHLFEPFFTTKGRGKGTGLGLSTVYGIVKQHGGEIRVTSEPGAGARFDVYLPAQEEQQDSPADSSPSRGRTRGTETILLVEDEDGVRRVARDVLLASGYRVLTANGGQEALRHAEQETGRIDLLLTDMIMPLMSGRELADRIKAMRKGIRVIYMSGYSDDVIAYHGDLGPAADFVQKPFAADMLARKVREVLDRGRQAASQGEQS